MLKGDVRLTGVSATLFGTGDGLLSQMFRLQLSYDSQDPSLPRTIVAKLPPPNHLARITGSLLSLFAYEHAFYEKNLGSKIGMNVPRCFYTGIGDYGRYCILLSDFAPARPPDQVKGMSLEQVTEALEQISKLHAKYRGRVIESPELKDWVLRQDDDSYFSLALKEFKKKFSGITPCYATSGISDPDNYRHAHRLGKWLDTFGSDKFLTFLSVSLRRRQRSCFPATLCHGDLRAENMLFPQKGLDEFMIFDFQMLKEINGMMDVAYLIQSSMCVADRRAHERKLLATYISEMRKRGATDITWKEVLFGYQIYTTVTAVIAYFALKDNMNGPEKNDPKTKATTRAYIERLNEFVRDWMVVEALEELLKHVNETDGTFRAYDDTDFRRVVPKKFHDLLDLDDDNSCGASTASSKTSDGPSKTGAASPSLVEIDLKTPKKKIDGFV